MARDKQQQYRRDTGELIFAELRAHLECAEKAESLNRRDGGAQVGEACIEFGFRQRAQIGNLAHRLQPRQHKSGCIGKQGKRVQRIRAAERIKHRPSGLRERHYLFLAEFECRFETRVFEWRPRTRECVAMLLHRR